MEWCKRSTCSIYTNQEQAWIEAECPEACQRLPRRSEIHYVAVRRLRKKNTGHNWKVAYIVPQPSLLISGEPLLYRRLHLNGASGVGGLNPRGRAARNQPSTRHYLGGGLFG